MKNKQFYIKAELTAIVRMQVPDDVSDEKAAEVAKERLCEFIPQSGSIYTEFDNVADVYVECSDESDMEATEEDPDYRTAGEGINLQYINVKRAKGD